MSIAYAKTVPTILFYFCSFVLLLFYYCSTLVFGQNKSGTKVVQKTWGEPLEGRDNYCNTLRTTSEAIWTSRIT